MNRRIFQLTALSAVLAFAVCMPGCAPALRREAPPAGVRADGYEYPANAWIDDLAGHTGALSPADAAALAGMTRMLETGEAALYMGAQYDIAVQDKRTGAVFFSSPGLYQAGAVLSDGEKSQLSIEFYDASDTMTVMTSFPDCVDDAGRNQVAVEPAADHVRVVYAFGTDDSGRILCPAFTGETYDALIAKTEELIETEELTIMSVGRFKLGYLQVVYENLTDTERDIYGKQYPRLKELGELYVLKPALNDLQKRQIDEVSKALGIDEAFVAQELEKLGETPENQTASPYFVVPLEYRLDHGDLLVTVDMGAVVEQKTYRLTRLHLLGGFGAVAPEEGNSLFIPDGSGSVIPSRPAKEYTTEFTVPFYGADNGLDIRRAEDVPANASFPVFGLDGGSRAVFAVAESGEALAGVTARPAGEFSPAGRMVPYTQYRVADSIDLRGMGSSQRRNVYSEPAVETPFILRYHFLYGEAADYSGMARYYRAYLLARGMLRADGRQAAESPLPLDLGLVGAFSKKEMRFGLQQENAFSATAFGQAEELLARLAKGGISAPDVRYLGVLNGGLDHTLLRTAKLIPALGTAAEYRALGAGGRLFTAADFSAVYKKGNGLDEQFHLARYLSKAFVTRAVFRPADGTRDPARPAYLVSPAVYGSLAKAFSAAYDASLADGLFLPFLASELSGDYREGSELSREQSKLLTVALLEQLSGSYTLKTDGAHIYTLRYAGSIAGIPVDNSRHKLAQTAVPFVGMVLHGSLPYTGPVVNQQSDPRLAVLQSIESGAGLNYLLMQSDPIVLSGTDYTDLYSLSAQRWLPEMMKEYTRAAAALEGLSRVKIEGHRRVGPVAETRYENGVRVLVNYGNKTAELDGLAVPARDYIVERKDSGA